MNLFRLSCQYRGLVYETERYPCKWGNCLLVCNTYCSCVHVSLPNILLSMLSNCDSYLVFCPIIPKEKKEYEEGCPIVQ